MGLLTKVSNKLLRKSSPEEINTKSLDLVNRDNRLHSRYRFSKSSFVKLSLQNGAEGSVLDISYGGLAVNLSMKKSEEDNLTKNLKGQLSILDQSIELQLNLVRYVPITQKESILAGFSIAHNNADSLIFMRDLIEPLRYGRSLAPLAPSLRHENRRGPEWACLRGDGPTDLILRFGKDQKTLLEGLLTFRNSDYYCELRFQDQQFRTGKMLARDDSKLAILDQVASTADIDIQVVRSAIYILLGTESPVSAIVEPFLQETLKWRESVTG